MKTRDFSLSWATRVALVAVAMASFSPGAVAFAQDAGVADAGPAGDPQTEVDEAQSEDEKEAEETAQETVISDPVDAPGRSPASTKPAPDTKSAAGRAEEEQAKEEQEEEEIEEKIGASSEKDDPLAWRNSIFVWGSSLSANTLAPDAGISYNPTFSTSFRIRPRYYLTNQLYLALDQSLSIELTDTDIRARNREPVLSDTLLDLIWAGAYATDLGFGGLSLTPGLRVQAPLSIASRAQTMILGIGPSLLALAPINDVMSGWVLGASGRWLHYFSRSNVPENENNQYCVGSFDSVTGTCTGGFADGGEDDPNRQLLGNSVVHDRLIFALFSSLSFVPNATFDLSFAWVWDFGYGLADARVPVMSEPDGELVIADQSDTHLRLLTSFSVGFSYTFEPWINASLSLNTFQGEFQADGDRSNPFFDIDVTTIDLGVTVTLDRFYTDVIVGADPDAGGPTNPSMRAGGRPALRAF